MYTSDPGFQLYTGNYLNGQYGKNKESIGKWSGICLEPSRIVNGINSDNIEFRNGCILKQNQVYRTRTRWVITSQRKKELFGRERERERERKRKKYVLY